MNLSRWFSGGYQDWLKQQACLDQLRTRLEFASEFLHEDSSQHLDRIRVGIGLLRLYSLLTDFDPPSSNLKSPLTQALTPAWSTYFENSATAIFGLKATAAAACPQISCPNPC